MRRQWSTHPCAALGKRFSDVVAHALEDQPGALDQEHHRTGRFGVQRPLPDLIRPGQRR